MAGTTETPTTDTDLCPACLEDLNRPSACDKTKGGMVTHFLIGLKEDVATWPAKKAAATRTSMVDHVQTETASNLTMKAGKRMFKVDTKRDSAELKYEMQGESGTRSFKGSLEVFAPSARAAVLGFMSATLNAEMVILAKTRAGDWHLLGDEDEGAEYDSGDVVTGKVGGDVSGATLTFSKDVDAPTIYLGETDGLLDVAL